MNTKNKKDYSHIYELGEERREFVLHPENNSNFVRTGRQIIEACQFDISISDWCEELKNMLEKVAIWSKKHADKVLACFATTYGAGIGLFFIPQSETFDFDLADELAQLTLILVRKFKVGMVESHQIPVSELDRFLIRENTCVVYTDANITHKPVEA